MSETIGFLFTLAKQPFHILVSFSIVGFSILFAPTNWNNAFDSFRNKWEGEIIFFTISVVFLSIAAGFYKHYNQLKVRQKNSSLKLTLLDNECWWNLAKQYDNSFITQILLKINVRNLTSQPIGLIKTRLIRPKAKNRTLHSVIMLPNNYNIYDRKHKVFSHDSAKAQLDINVSGILKPKGKNLSVIIGITDELGQEYQLKAIIAPMTRS